MRRFIIFVGLLLLVIFVVFSYITFADEGIWYIFDEETLIPAGSLEKLTFQSKSILKPAAWVFLGIFVLLYLKILWKLISFNWKNKAAIRVERVKVKQSIR